MTNEQLYNLIDNLEPKETNMEQLQLRNDLLEKVDIEKMVNFLKIKQEAEKKDWIGELKDGDTFILQIASRY